MHILNFLLQKHVSQIGTERFTSLNLVSLLQFFLAIFKFIILKYPNNLKLLKRRLDL